MRVYFMLVSGVLAILVHAGCTRPAGSTPSTSPSTAHTIEHRSTAMFTTIEVAPGVRRPLTIIVPGPDVAPPAPAAGWPAIVFLHGRGECGTDGVRSVAVGLPPAAIADPRRWPFIVIVPQKPGNDETWESHESYVRAAVEHACREHPIDRSRIYLTGLSQGGAGTWAIAARHPGLFAAIAPVCGFAHATVPREQGVGFGDDAQVAGIAAALVRADMPIWAFHGERDDVVPPLQTRWLISAVEADRGGPSPRVRTTYFETANHNAWDPAYRDTGAELAAWFLSHRRP